MRELGIDAYRFSLSWPRCSRTAPGRQPGGLAFYDRLIDELLAAGIRPMATLFHWDTPLELEQRGGWRRRDTAAAVRRVRRAIAGEALRRPRRQLGHDQRAVHGHARGLRPRRARARAGLVARDPARRPQPAARPRPRRAGAARGRSRGRIGITNVHTPVVPATDSPKDAAYAELFDFLHNRLFADPVLLGRNPTPPRGVGPLGAALGILSRSSKRDLASCRSRSTSTGSTTTSRRGSPPGRRRPAPATPTAVSEAMDSRAVPPRPSGPSSRTTGFGWPIAPEYLRVVLETRDRYGDALPPVIITEGGASFPDVVGADGAVDDSQRIDYLAEHLAVAARGRARSRRPRATSSGRCSTTSSGPPGYTQRFGLVHVDFETQERTPKASFGWLQAVLRIAAGRDSRRSPL